MKNWIRMERARIEITQQELANAIGVSVQTINALEKYRFYPTHVLAMKIANYFKKPVTEIFILEEDD